MSSIDSINLTDPTESGRPVTRALGLCVVGDLAFVSVEEVDEGNPTTTRKVIAEMVVSLPTLRDAVVLLCQDRDRESLRPTDKHGSGMPDIAGNRFVVTPV